MTVASPKKRQNTKRRAKTPTANRKSTPNRAALPRPHSRFVSMMLFLLGVTMLIAGFYLADPLRIWSRSTGQSLNAAVDLLDETQVAVNQPYEIPANNRTRPVGALADRLGITTPNPSYIDADSVNTGDHLLPDYLGTNLYENGVRKNRISVGLMTRLPGGSFRMGDDFLPYSDVRPAHDVRLRPFWIDLHEVTNRQFMQFVAETQYTTYAESEGWAYVFDTESGGWTDIQGASWRKPSGPTSSIQGLEDYPVVQVCWYDAIEYARWAGRRLPTEAEWEYAARAGLRDTRYPWGKELSPNDQAMANYWQGWFPESDTMIDGYDSLAPAACFPASRFGLYDIAGNTWEWCADWHDPTWYDMSESDNPTGPTDGTMRVQRGGSWLSSETHEPGYQVALRSKRRPTDRYQDVGFRCAADDEPLE